MNSSKLFRLPVITSCAALGLFVATEVYAQAPSGPIVATPATAADGANRVTPPPPPLPPPRTTILGKWSLNKDDSDDPRDSERESQDSGGYGRRGGGWPGNGGGGGYGGRRAGGMNDEQREQMRELLTPPRSFTFAMTGAEVDLLDDHDRKIAFITDGRKLQKSKDPAYTEVSARFEGAKLISDEKDPRGNQMSRTFELSEDGRQLFETLRMTGGRNKTQRMIRYVYDIPPLPAPRQ